MSESRREPQLNRSRKRLPATVAIISVMMLAISAGGCGNGNAVAETAEPPATESAVLPPETPYIVRPTTDPAIAQTIQAIKAARETQAGNPPQQPTINPDATTEARRAEAAAKIEGDVHAHSIIHWRPPRRGIVDLTPAGIMENHPYGPQLDLIDEYITHFPNIKQQYNATGTPNGNSWYLDHVKEFIIRRELAQKIDGGKHEPGRDDIQYHSLQMEVISPTEPIVRYWGNVAFRNQAYRLVLTVKYTSGYVKHLKEARRILGTTDYLASIRDVAKIPELQEILHPKPSLLRYDHEGPVPAKYNEWPQWPQ